MNGVIYVQNSKNSKLLSSNSRIDCTYASINNSCSKTCPLKNKGCYGQLAYTGIINVRLNKESENLSSLQIAKEEALAIDNSYNGNLIPDNTYLRLHVIGDSRTIIGSKLINESVGRWLNRNGTLAFGYTHSWKNVHRNIWSNVSMLASIENPKQVSLIRENNYAPALIVSEHLSNKTYIIPTSDTKWIPCPAQLNKNIGCANCKLCFNCDRLYDKNMGIAFATHGVRKNILNKTLNKNLSK